MTIEPVSLTLPPATIPQTERLPACDRLLDSEPAKVVDRAWDELVDWFDRQREWVELVASLESVR